MKQQNKDIIAYCGIYCGLCSENVLIPQTASKLKEYLEMEKEFINKHLIRWIPGFCDAVIKSSNIKVYRDVAKLTKKFIIADKGLVDEMTEK